MATTAMTPPRTPAGAIVTKGPALSVSSLWPVVSLCPEPSPPLSPVVSLVGDAVTDSLVVEVVEVVVTGSDDVAAEAVQVTSSGRFVTPKPAQRFLA